MNADDFLRMFAYDHWANREWLRAMRAGDDAPSGTVKRIAHILSAEKLWLERIRREPQSMPVWPELDDPNSAIKECEAMAAEMAPVWRNYLNEIGRASCRESR